MHSYLRNNRILTIRKKMLLYCSQPLFLSLNQSDSTENQRHTLIEPSHLNELSCPKDLPIFRKKRLSPILSFIVIINANANLKAVFSDSDSLVLETLPLHPTHKTCPLLLD